MRKTLGIVNIVAGVAVLFLTAYLVAVGFLKVGFNDSQSAFYWREFLPAIIIPITSGTLVLTDGRLVWKVIASISLTLIIIVIFLLFPAFLFALFGD